MSIYLQYNSRFECLGRPTNQTVAEMLERNSLNIRLNSFVISGSAGFNVLCLPWMQLRPTDRKQLGEYFLRQQHVIGQRSSDVQCLPKDLRLYFHSASSLNVCSPFLHSDSLLPQKNVQLHPKFTFPIC